MNYFNGTLLYTSTGLKTAINVFDMVTGLPFTPKTVRVTCGQKLGMIENLAHFSEGSGWANSDGTDGFQRANSIFQDTTGGKTLSTDGVICNHMARVSGSIVEAQKIKLHSIPTNQIRFEVIAPLSVFYPIYVEAWG